MHAILKAGTAGGEIAIRSHIERPAAMSDTEATALWAARQW
jgi:hypothetical protein